MSNVTTTPLIIEVALNGMVPKRRNPNTPLTPEEIASDALRCLRAGASIIHNHTEDYSVTGLAAAQRFIAGWQPIVREFPQVILSPTATAGATIEQRWEHNAILAQAGFSAMGWLDPGSLNVAASSGAEGLPARSDSVYLNTFADIEYAIEHMKQHALGASIAIFEPGFLRLVTAYERNGRLPRGSLVRFYFGGDHNPMSGVYGGLSWGLPPTRKALDAYLELMEGSALPWMVAVAGGDVTATGMTRWAVERGGHVRVGIEDYAGSRQPCNHELIEEVIAICREVGRPVADCATARRMLNLPRERVQPSAAYLPGTTNP